MIKYFHELTKDEFKEIVESKKYTYGILDLCYPQPKWCNHLNATHGLMGCWSLVSFLVTGKDYCKSCDEYKSIDGNKTRGKK